MSWYLESIEAIIRLLGEVALVSVAFGSITRLGLPKAYQQAAYGVLFGFASAITLLSPVAFSNGVTIDGHYLAVAFSAAFGGPITLLITVPIGAVLRSWLQAPVAPSYFVSVIAVGLLGLTWHVSVRPRLKTSLLSLTCLGAILSLQLLLFFLLPIETALPLFLGTLPAGSVTCIIGSILMGKFIEREFRHINIERAWAREALTDVLTDLPNRRALEIAAPSFPEGAYVCVVDVDHFKRLNDEYGHDTGDIVLRAVAKSLRKSASKLGQAYRTGGEEFTLVVECQTIVAAKSFAISARLAVEQLQIEGVNRPVTVSIGVAPIDVANNAHQAIRMADKALYLAKSSGRNRVSTSLDFIPLEKDRSIA